MTGKAILMDLAGISSRSVCKIPNVLRVFVNRLCEVIFARLLSFFIILCLGLAACSSGPEIPDKVVEKEFRHAWYAIHGENGQKGYRWKLVSLKTSKINVKPKKNTAVVSIAFTYMDAAGKSYNRRGKFNFLKKGNTWEIEDRGARSMTSSTRYQITP